MKRFPLPKLVGTLALVGAALGGLPAPVQGQPTSPFTEYQHRALYLFNFAKYTQWPGNALPEGQTNFVVGILGEDPFGKDIDIIKGKTIKGRTLVVKRFEGVDEIDQCHILYIHPSEDLDLAEALHALGDRGILTVSETGGFLEKGGMINFVVERKPGGFATIGFEINQAAAERARLKLDIQLLRLAKRVKH